MFKFSANRRNHPYDQSENFQPGIGLLITTKIYKYIVYPLNWWLVPLDNHLMISDNIISIYIIVDNLDAWAPRPEPVFCIVVSVGA